MIYFGEKFSIYFTGAMGSGGSKKSNLDVGYNPDRRPSQHELTNPPTESRGLSLVLSSESSLDHIPILRQIDKNGGKSRTVDLSPGQLCPSPGGL